MDGRVNPWKNSKHKRLRPNLRAPATRAQEASVPGSARRSNCNEPILSERTSSPHRRSALAYALADIEEKLAELGWSVHM